MENSLVSMPIVVKIEDNSEYYMKRLRLTFDNGRGLSIIAGDGGYSEPREVLPEWNQYTRVEVGLLDNNDLVYNDVPLSDDPDIAGVDDVLGYVPVEKLPALAQLWHDYQMPTRSDL